MRSHGSEAFYFTHNSGQTATYTSPEYEGRKDQGTAVYERDDRDSDEEPRPFNISGVYRMLMLPAGEPHPVPRGLLPRPELPLRPLPPRELRVRLREPQWEHRALP